MSMTSQCSTSSRECGSRKQISDNCSAVLDSPTYQKWMKLEKGEALRYACREFIKGQEDDDDKLVKRIMQARNTNDQGSDEKCLKAAMEKQNLAGRNIKEEAKRNKIRSKIADEKTSSGRQLKKANEITC